MRQKGFDEGRAAPDRSTNTQAIVNNYSVVRMRNDVVFTIELLLDFSRLS